MAKFFYTATSLEGESKTGSIEARDEKELAKSLRREGYILVSASKDKPKKNIEILFSIGGVPLKEKLFFTRNFRLMIKAGVPLPKSLKMLSSQANSNKLKRVLLEIREDVIKGKSSFYRKNFR